jgi:3-phenylpropionate/trans-cinnamate dioxygenase ferredoxin subunit
MLSTLTKLREAAVGWCEVPGAQALGEDEAMAAEIGKRPIAVCRSGGALYALDNVCTHQFALLSDGYIEDGSIECPLHQGRFDLKTGAPLCAPVTQPVRVYAVKSENGAVYVDLGD